MYLLASKNRNNLKITAFFLKKCRRGTIWYCARLEISFPHGYPGSNPGVGVLKKTKSFKNKLGILENMKGAIASFRGSRRLRKGNQCIVKVDKIEKKEDAEKLVGKIVKWQTTSTKEKREITGKVTAAHGNSGALRVLFEKGMPGQSLGTEVNIE